MRSLLVLLLLAAFQDPPVDDIGKAFPNPVPPDRAWEMALAYCRRIAEHVRAGDYDQARAWDRFARARLPETYKQRLTKEGAAFWPQLRNLAVNRQLVEKTAVHFIIAISGGEERDAPKLRARIDARREFDTEDYFTDLAIALTRYAEGKFEAALGHLEAVEKEYTKEWIPDQLNKYRNEIREVSAGGVSPADLATTFGSAAYIRDRSWGPTLAVMKRIAGALKSTSDVDAKTQLRQTAVQVLKSLGDEEGARALEDKLVSDPSTPAGESRNVMAQRAYEASAKGDHKAAEDIYRQMLKRWPQEPAAWDLLFELAVSVRKQARPAEARGIFERIAAIEAPDRPRPRDHTASLKTRAQLEIGACHEDERNWAKALDAYLACPDDLKDDGHGRGYRDFTLRESIFRCRLKLNQLDPALAVCRDSVLSPGRVTPRLVVGYVETAIALGRVEAEEETIRAAPAGEEAAGRTMALEFLRILKLRSERDAAGLFGMVRGEGSSFLNLHHVRNWEDLRWKEGWLTVEAIECLAELGDQAVDHLVPIVRLGLDRAHLALVALGRVQTDRARDLIKNLDWADARARTGADALRRLSQGGPRESRRLPEKRAVPPDPKLAERNREATARIRARLPELTSKVKGIDELLAQETNAARFQALGETIVAWKKGEIVDEDFEDLVAFAIEDRWSLDSKDLVTLIRNHRAAPAGPLIERAFTDWEPRVRAEAAEVAGMFRLSAFIPQLTELLKDKDGEVVGKALNSLVWLKAKDRIPAIAAGLKDPHRAGPTMFALASLGSNDHEDEIAGFLDHKDPSLRATAAQALATLGARRYAGKISVLLQDKVEWVRKAAAEALKKLQS